MSVDLANGFGPADSLKYHPFAAVDRATLLEWAHMSEPPYDLVRAAAPWLLSESEVRHYLDGAVQGQISFWRDGPLFGADRA